ncbi:MAG: flagellar type III secretion system pore protein FliP [Candidatus Cloacimonetes bacterium]|nr:flagellar type III secretion system pore protein FliP [Candidatus Cloacimonadota bacterium]
MRFCLIVLFFLFGTFLWANPVVPVNFPGAEKDAALFPTATGKDAVRDPGFAFPVPRVTLEMDDEMGPKELSLALKLLVLLTLLTLAPSILIMMTPFTRIIIVLSFVRKAIGTQTMPTDKMMVSLAIFLTLFHMSPVWNRINEDALKPFLENRLDYEVAFERGLRPLREYMRAATREADLALFVKMSRGDKPKSFDEVDTLTLIPAFIISEFKTGFLFGIILFLPFLMLDMVIATVLMSMGMMMLPPAMVSTPFKLLLFVLIDGWTLIVDALMRSIIVPG